MKRLTITLSIAVAALAWAFASYAQEKPPAPGVPRPVSVPPIREKKLPNGLTVAVVERSSVPLVTIQLLIKAGADAESEDKAGLADLTASMLTKGTATRTATEIAEAVDFLGGSIQSGAGWNSSFVSITVTSDKVDKALAILQDLVLHPKFAEDELDLLKSQTLDGLTYNLKQPSFIASYVASKYSLKEHPAGGTLDSVKGLNRSDVVAFHRQNYVPNNAVLIFAGNISEIKATALARTAFSAWNETSSPGGVKAAEGTTLGKSPIKRILVIDLPNSGQAAVNYYNRVVGIGRANESYYPALVLNSVLGGGYSSRLNYEIRIKRGLSYGAGSSFGWRSGYSNFSTRAQTKNESAAEVAELMTSELLRVSSNSVGKDELVPRKSVLTGNFGRNLETTSGLADALSDLYGFDIPRNALNGYVSSINSVSDAQIRSFAETYLPGGDIIIVGDYSVFKDDLAKRFPNVNVEVIKADDLDISKPNLRK